MPTILSQKIKENERVKTGYIWRNADESGVSGTGHVLDFVVFPDGQTVIRWCVEGKPNSTAIYPTFEAFKYIHIDAHPDNRTEIVFNSTIDLLDTIEEWCEEKKLKPRNGISTGDIEVDRIYKNHNKSITLIQDLISQTKKEIS